jgi:aminopeptidase
VLDFPTGKTLRSTSEESTVRDPRNARLAELIVRHSTALQSGEAVMIEAFDVSEELVLDLVEAVHRVGAIPVVTLRANAVNRSLISGGGEAQFRVQSEIELHQMQKVQAYVGLRGAHNSSELADVPPDRMSLYNRLVARPVHLDYRVQNTRWVVLRYPTPSMAQMANMSTEQFEEFFYRVCTLDYTKMGHAMEPLVARMQRTDAVRLAGPGTDLRFSIKGIGVVPCEGRRNLPDGECYTAPVRDSVEGTIRYNTPSLYLGTTFENLSFVFEKGRIVRATGTPQDRLDALLGTDEGARYVGEFSLGFNPHILTPMKDTLFDEKIAGSLHFTPGQAYTSADNGNRSQVHWDLVLIQRAEHGGGEVWFDGECIRKDGRFVTPDLEGLNPEKLV